MAKKIKDYLAMRGPEQDIPLDEIEVNLYQVRTENVATDEAEFMHEMKIAGVNFSPILVCLSSSESGSKYDLIYGQRRLNAADLLNWETIRGQLEIFARCSLDVRQMFNRFTRIRRALDEDWMRIGGRELDEDWRLSEEDWWQV